MSRRTLLGMLTPSSNTSLEPACADMLMGLPDVTAHFSRFRVTEISLSDAALGQFDVRPMVEAASLLADARVQSICWNGTSAGWMGLDQDRILCAAITEATGIPATTSMLALDEAFRLSGIERYALVSPYLDDVQARIIETYAGQGLHCVAERHLGAKENFTFSEIARETIAGMVRDVAAAGPQTIVILCTNLQSPWLIEPLEQETGIPIYDSTAAAVWGGLRAAGVDTGRLTGWGRLFRDVGTTA